MRVLRWFVEHWAEAITALATGASAFFLWLQRRDQLRSQEPEVECNLAQEKTGWISAKIIVRNFHPYSLHVTGLRIAKPKGCKICGGEALKWSNKAQRNEFIGDSLDLSDRLTLNETIKPYGTEATYLNLVRVKTSDGDSMSQTFYLLSPRAGKLRIKMFLTVELRMRQVRKDEIPIKRTITLSSTNSKV